MDKMFDSSFRYGVSSFPHTNTSCRVVVFRVRLVASRVRLVILSVRIVGWPLRLVVLRVRLVTDLIGSSSFVVLPFRRFVMTFRLVHSERL